MTHPRGIPWATIPATAEKLSCRPLSQVGAAFSTGKARLFDHSQVAAVVSDPPPTFRVRKRKFDFPLMWPPASPVISERDPLALPFGTAGFPTVHPRAAQVEH